MTFSFSVLLSASSSGCSIDPCWCLGQTSLGSPRTSQGEEEEGAVGARNPGRDTHPAGSWGDWAEAGKIIPEVMFSSARILLSNAL